MVICNNCMSNNERDNFIGCRSIDRMNEKKEAEAHESNERLQEMETRLTACVEKKYTMPSKQHSREWTEAVLNSRPFS